MPQLLTLPTHRNASLFELLIDFFIFRKRPVM